VKYLYFPLGYYHRLGTDEYQRPRHMPANKRHTIPDHNPSCQRRSVGYFGSLGTASDHNMQYHLWTGLLSRCARSLRLARSGVKWIFRIQWARQRSLVCLQNLHGEVVEDGLLWRLACIDLPKFNDAGAAFGFLGFRLSINLNIRNSGLTGQASEVDLFLAFRVLLNTIATL
jgi:hypothetical protein